MNHDKLGQKNRCAKFSLLLEKNAHLKKIRFSKSRPSSQCPNLSLCKLETCLDGTIPTWIQSFDECSHCFEGCFGLAVSVRPRCYAFCVQLHLSRHEVVSEQRRQHLNTKKTSSSRKICCTSRTSTMSGTTIPL